MRATSRTTGPSAPDVRGEDGGVPTSPPVTEALQPEFFRGDDWRFAYRTTTGMPSFVVAAGPSATDATSCFLDLRPGTAPKDSPASSPRSTATASPSGPSSQRPRRVRPR